MGNMENSVKPHENKMGTMPMTRLILTMSLPAIFSMTIQAMYNVVDSIFIGNYDADGNFACVSSANAFDCVCSRYGSRCKLVCFKKIR